MIPKAATAHYKRIQALQALLVLQAADMWGEVSEASLSESWASQVSLLEPVMASGQVRAAGLGAAYGAQALAQQRTYVAPESFVDAEAFGGFAANGRALAGALYSPIAYTKTLIGGGMSPREALVSGGKYLSGTVRTEIADASRGAAGADIAARSGVGYVRMLNPPTCKDCSILAGKFYRWNAGFKRHKRCDCVHVPAKGSDAATSEGLIHDPYEYFQSLSDAQQDKVYGQSNAQAVRDGADIFQVVNVNRGLKPGGLVTTEGTTRRGNYGAGKAPRLTPEGIYTKNLSRDQTRKLLEKNGYLLPGGQQPLGVIRGGREGYGALGRGGTRVGARQAIEQAQRTGVRDGSRYTMTESERRLSEAQLSWDAVIEGRNPRGKGPLTPDIAAQAEAQYRKMLASGGQKIAD